MAIRVACIPQVAILMTLTLAVVRALPTNQAIKKTIKSENGDIIDCVDIYKQPAFDNPLLKGHKIYTKPSRSAREVFGISSPPTQIQQEWQKGGACPEGTVPILRTHARSTIAARNFTMTPSFSKDSFQEQDAAAPTAEWAVAYSERGIYHGGYAEICVWNIHVEPNEFSANFLLIGDTTDGKFPPALQPLYNAKNAISAGWTVNPIIYGDTKPRTYFTWSKNASGGQICWNLECQSFIQTNKNIGLGAELHTSQPGGNLQLLPISLHRAAEQPVWWLAFDYEEIGYIPSAAFNDFNECTFTAFGGQVWDTHTRGQHTATQMGSGFFTSRGYEYAGMVGNYLGVNFTGNLFFDYPTGNVVTDPNCYDYKELGKEENHDGYYLLYGGPGGPECDGHGSAS